MDDHDDISPIPQDAWALTDFEAAIAVVGAAAGSAYGPVGAILGAMVGPYAKRAVERFMQLRSAVDEAGLDEARLVELLDENETLAQLVAEVVRGSVESDLQAKRMLLARAAIRALSDDAVVDIEARFVRTATQVDTFDIRVLAYLGERTVADSSKNRELTVSADQVAKRWPGAAHVVYATLSSLKAAGLAEDPSPGAIRAGDNARITVYGRAFLERLLEEGLEDELRRRDNRE